MYIEGKNAIKQALDGNITINKIMVDKNIQGRKDDIIELAVKHKIKYLKLVIIKAILQKV